MKGSLAFLYALGASTHFYLGCSAAESFVGNHRLGQSNHVRRHNHPAKAFLARAVAATKSCRQRPTPITTSQTVPVTTSSILNPTITLDRTSVLLTPTTTDATSHTVTPNIPDETSIVTPPTIPSNPEPTGNPDAEIDSIRKRRLSTIIGTLSGAQDIPDW